MVAPHTPGDGHFLGDVEEGMLVFDLYSDPVGTVRQIDPGQTEEIVIADGVPGLEYAATAEQLADVDPVDGVTLNVPRHLLGPHF